MKKLHTIKALAAGFLAAAALQGSVGLQADAVHQYDEAVLDTITVSSSTIVPSTLAEGNSVIIRGTLKSASSRISGVNVGVFDTEGHRVTGRTVYPGTYSYDLNQMDDYVLFDTLEPGTYYYRVYASNTSVAGMPLVDQEFTVKAAAAAAAENVSSTNGSVTLIGGTNVPDSITQGNGVSVQGTVKSDSKITALTAGIFDADGQRVYGKTVYPGTKTFILSVLDRTLAFSQLEPGTYSYQVIAANAEGSNQVLTNQSFTVKARSEDKQETASSEASVTLSSGTKVPSSLTEGYGVIVRGTVKSPDSKITALTAGVYDENGKRITGRTIYPGTNSYDLNKLDDYVLFSALEPGTYSYQVIAANADGNNHVLTSQSFTVKASSRNEASEAGRSYETSGPSVTLTDGTSMPSRLTQGYGVIVKGTVKSSGSELTALTVGVYNENGKRLTGKTVYPGTYSYNLSNLDDYVLFSDLEPGTYSYQVIAANEDDNNHVLTNQSFTVKSAAAQNTNTAEGSPSVSSGQSAALSGGTDIPSRIAAGDGVAISGTVSSPSKITALTVAVYDTDGWRVTGKTVYPGTYTYDLSRLDSYLNFHKLEGGVYSYEVIVANEDSNNVILTNQTFRVIE
ncbi:MAG: hypothetical protein IJ496_09135 [Ruminococcus sp.]|nr:hypothetical protein [Ruminococcus sp.]